MGRLIASNAPMSRGKGLVADGGRTFISLFFRRGGARPNASGACDDAAGFAVLPSPVVPWKGAPLRVDLAAEKPLEGELR